MSTDVARAKINLYLDVLGKRSDGYHDLETLFFQVAWGDRVRVDCSDARTVADAKDVDVRLTLAGATDGVPDDERNLAVRAARMALAARRPPLPAQVAITIDKVVPVGGGLGGGSADAAQVLRSLAPPDPQALARALGADVPFALLGGAAVGTARGDRLRPVPDAAYDGDVVLIVPPFGCDTARVFAGAHERVRPAPRDGLAVAVAALRAGAPDGLRAAHYNALALSALRAVPALGVLARDVERRLGRPPALSGSGSTLYDLPDAGDTQRVVEALRGVGAAVHVVRP